jgi:hypothetical protein
MIGEIFSLPKLTTKFFKQTKMFLVIGSMLEIKPLLIEHLNFFGQCPKHFWAKIKINFEWRSKNLHNQKFSVAKKMVNVHPNGQN